MGFGAGLVGWPARPVGLAQLGHGPGGLSLSFFFVSFVFCFFYTLLSFSFLLF